MSKGALGCLRGCSESVFPFLLCFYTLHIQKIHGQYLPCLHLREIIHQSHLSPASEMHIFLRVSYCNVPTADGSRLKMCTLCHFWWFFFPFGRIQHFSCSHCHLQRRLCDHRDNLCPLVLQEEEGLSAEASIHVLHLRRYGEGCSHFCTWFTGQHRET